ncbi:MAG: hypothetical protein KGI04_03990 [Candidatus Micrarchaeota archaeon]|nr:hypothetical protein [Candidatus Micrarchaeota archaeon]
MAKAAAANDSKGKEKGKTDDKKAGRGRSGIGTALMIAVPILLAFVAFFAVVLPSLSVPFSTFKGNFQAAQRVAVVASYYSQDQAGSVLQCATQAVQVAAHYRNATTIDFFVLNGTGCTYPIGGLGHTVSLATNTTANCLNMTRSEPTLILNYSAVNRTSITPYRLYIGGDAAYMAQCPIAVDLS